MPCQLTAAMVRAYRQRGFLHVPDVIPDVAINLLRTAAANTIARRGPHGVVPVASPSVAPGLTTTNSVAAGAAKRRRWRSIGARLRHEKKILMRQYGMASRELLPTAPPVDTKKLLSLLASRKVSPTQEQICRTLFCSSSAQGFVKALSSHEKTFFYTWREEPLLREFVMGGHLGTALGEAAAQLLGTLAVRMYSDCLSVRMPLSNWMPMGVDMRAEHRCVSIVIPLTSPSSPGTPFLQVLSGSHHSVGAAVAAGKLSSIDASPFSSTPFFAALPGICEEHESCMIPFPEPGSCLFLHNLLVRSLYPLMTSERSASCGSSLDEAASSYFTVSVIPDGMLHDGSSRGWLTDDAQGPLYGMKKGAVVNDPQLFPLLYMADPLV
jgi:hypothetical protein